MKLDWKEDQVKNCRYDNSSAKTPFGMFLITWHEGGDSSWFAVYEFVFGDKELHRGRYISLEAAQEACQEQFDRALSECVKEETKRNAINCRCGELKMIDIEKRLNINGIDKLVKIPRLKSCITQAYFMGFQEGVREVGLTLTKALDVANEMLDDDDE